MQEIGKSDAGLSNNIHTHSHARKISHSE